MTVSGAHDILPPQGFDARNAQADERQANLAKRADYDRILAQRAHEEESADHRTVGAVYRPPGMGRWVDRFV
jgi:hypothetical protein